MKLDFLDGFIVTLNIIVAIGWNFSSSPIATPLACFHTLVVTAIVTAGILKYKDENEK